MGVRGGRLKDAGSFSITYNLPYWWLKVVGKASMGDIDSIVYERFKGK